MDALICVLSLSTRKLDRHRTIDLWFYSVFRLQGSEDFCASKGAQNTELGTNTEEYKKDFVKFGKKFWSIVMKIYNSGNILIMLPSCSLKKIINTNQLT